MERLKELINQLKDQFDRKAEHSQMLETTRLLEAELRLLAAQPQPAKVMPTKIAVMMPSATKYSAQPAAPVPPEPKKETVNQRNGASVAAISSVASGTSSVYGSAANNVAVNSSPLAAAQPSIAPAPATATSPVAAPATATLQPIQERGQWPFDPLAEKPIDRFTLSQKAREVNDVIGANATSSLNDKLKSDVSDLKSALNDTPVRDLRKAIGVNDRYVFINQLFRGDEVMYERSLKTINGFRILPEAEYWMERELKVKLGWDENREITRHFYQLVKRRFS
jgi:hypothetical protein